MKKFSEQIKKHRAIIIICALLAVLVIAGVILLDGKTKKVAGYGSYSRSETEEKLMRILSEIDGVGQSEVMITEREEGIEGVVIVCQGAENIMVRNDVLNAVSCALNVQKSNIAIYAMNK